MAWELVEEESPSSNIAKDVLRQSLRTGEKLITRAQGLPGDIFSLVNEYIAKPVTKSIFGEAPEYEQTLLGKVLPTTQTRREKFEEGFGDYFKPQNKIESFADDVIEDTALMFIPGGKAAKFTKPAAKLTMNLAKSLGANFLGETVEQLSGSKEAGQATKAGALFISSLLDAPSAAKQVGNLYKKAEAALPQGASINVSNKISRLNAIKNQVIRGRPYGNLSENEKWIVDQVEKVENLIQNGMMAIEQGWAQKRSLGEELGKKIYDIPFKQRKNVRNLAKQVNGWLNEVLEDYGRTNPAFGKPFEAADLAFGTLAKSNFISNWVEQNIKMTPLTTGLAHVFGKAVATAALPVAVSAQTAKLTYRIAKSPALAKIYANAMKAAAKEDAVAFNKYLSDLDEGLQKEESKEKWQFID